MSVATVARSEHRAVVTENVSDSAPDTGLIAALTVWSGRLHDGSGLANTTVASTPRLILESSTVVPYDLPHDRADAFAADGIAMPCSARRPKTLWIPFCARFGTGRATGRPVKEAPAPARAHSTVASLIGVTTARGTLQFRRSTAQVSSTRHQRSSPTTSAARSRSDSSTSAVPANRPCTVGVERTGRTATWSPSRQEVASTRGSLPSNSRRSCGMACFPRSAESGVPCGLAGARDGLDEFSTISARAACQGPSGLPCGRPVWRMTATNGTACGRRRWTVSSRRRSG